MNSDFLQKLKEGWEGNCCNCGQYSKIYHRRIHSVMAVQLIQLYKLGGAHEYFHVRRLMMRGSSGIGDFSKAAYWKIIDELPNDSTEKKASGHWKLNQLGVQFVTGEISLPTYALVYNAQVLGFSGSMSSISQCLQNKFNYEELMGETTL